MHVVGGEVECTCVDWFLEWIGRLFVLVLFFRAHRERDVMICRVGQGRAGVDGLDVVGAGYM